MLDTIGSGTTVIELRDIVKRFPGVVANNGVNLTTLQARHGKKVTLSAGGDDA